MTNREQFHIGPDLVIPPIAVGTMNFGTTVPDAAAQQCLDEAFDIGARFWDTANNYAFWNGGVGDDSEACLGSWLGRRGAAVRAEVVIATKVGARPSDSALGFASAMGLSATAIREQVIASLRRLGTDYIDVLYAHIDDPSTPFEETLGEMSSLVDQGLVREIGASNLTASRLCEAMETRAGRSYAALQQRFTFLEPAAGTDLSPHILLDNEVQAVCTETGITPLGYAPLLGGAYTRTDRPLPNGYDSASEQRSLGVLREVAAANGLDAGQAVLAWMGQRDVPVIPVVGVSAPEQVASAWSAVTSKLSATDLHRLDAARDV